MTTMQLAVAMLAATLFAGPAMATSSYTFKKGEYVTIASGLSPDKKMSIAANGDGEFGDENFYLYLMAEPAHKVISRITVVSSDTALGSDPKEFTAVWSSDSRHVGINFRQGRRSRDTVLFAIRKRRAELIEQQDMLAVMLGRPLADLNLNVELEPNSRSSLLTWQSPTRLTIEVFREHLVRSRADAEKLLGMLYAYGRMEEYNENLFAVRFSAAAVYDIVNGDEYPLIDIKPGQFRK